MAAQVPNERESSQSNRAARDAPEHRPGEAQEVEDEGEHCVEDRCDAADYDQSDRERIDRRESTLSGGENQEDADEARKGNGYFGSRLEQ